MVWGDAEEEPKAGGIFAEAVRDEAALRGALAEADIALLLMVLVQLSGELDIPGQEAAAVASIERLTVG